ncbi:MAG TPA: N-acetyl-gamma-glutamyl-phosphate reductase [Acidimicrobiia bacterium]|jgi:N-acetyl-gamma-glutamyl-phosphate reductase|nr:N-acetyl-gamma-glutamyl-phosphate reductase [Acidimicrobiia bacterium]
MAYQAAVIGASGYAGAELLRLLVGHPDLAVATAVADTHAGDAVAGLYPSLARAYPGLTLEPLEPAALDGLDAVFVALPHGQSQRLAPQLVGRVGHLVDLGADFRLPAPLYEQWYGEPHEAPQLLPSFAFGLPELFRDRITPEISVAAPGCYPTASVLALAPLLATGLAEPDGIVVHAVSGLSGRGRGLSTGSLFSEANETVAPYGLLNHRHTGEIEWALGEVRGAPVQVLFTPHLAPMTRGLLASCYARPATGGLTTARLLDLYREFYAQEPFVVVLDEPPTTKATLGSNTAHLTVRLDDRTGSILAFGALDNLGKGAAGQAIQAANLVLGLPEATGLPLVGLEP